MTTVGKKRSAESIAKYKRTMARKRRAKERAMGEAPAPKYRKGPRDLSLTKVAPGLYLIRVL